MVPWGTRERNAWGQPGSCGGVRALPLPRLAVPGISRIFLGRVSRHHHFLLRRATQRSVTISLNRVKHDLPWTRLDAHRRAEPIPSRCQWRAQWSQRRRQWSQMEPMEPMATDAIKAPSCPTRKTGCPGKRSWAPFRGLPRVLRLVWDVQPFFTVALGVLNIVQGFVPAATAWVIAQLVDAVVAASRIRAAMARRRSSSGWCSRSSASRRSRVCSRRSRTSASSSCRSRSPSRSS